MSSEKALTVDGFKDVVMAWQAPSFLRFHRGWVWFLGFTMVAAGLTAYGIASQNWIMASVFIIAYLVVLLEHRKQPEAVNVIISTYGIQFGPKKIPYSKIRAFWIHHELPNFNELHLLTNEKSHPELQIHLMHMNPALVRQYLATQVREWEGKTTSFTEILVRILRLQ